MSETKHTAGALRAALRIQSAKLWYADHNFDDLETTADYANEMAHIIDREMARPKVEEAIRAANAAEKWRESQREPTLRADEWQAILAKLREVAAALGGKAE